MRLIINSRQGATAGGRLRRYNGSGIFSSIGRKLFSSGMKKALLGKATENLSQKVADLVVDGAQAVGKKLGKTVGKKLGSAARKRLVPSPTVAVEGETSIPPAKRSKVDIDRLIDGSGIVLD